MSNRLEYKWDTIIITFRSYISETKLRQWNENDRGDSKVREGQRTVPITHEREATVIKEVTLTESPRNGIGREND